MKMKKTLIILLIVLIGMFVYGLNVYATDSIIQGAEDFMQVGDESILDKAQIKKVSDSIFNIFIAVGTSVVVIVGSVIGIKLMTASNDEKAQIKENILPYAIGSMVIFGSVIIWGIAVKIVQNVF